MSSPHRSASCIKCIYTLCDVGDGADGDGDVAEHRGGRRIVRVGTPTSVDNGALVARLLTGLSMAVNTGDYCNKFKSTNVIPVLYL